jgi:hypothetical protein
MSQHLPPFAAKAERQRPALAAKNGTTLGFHEGELKAPESVGQPVDIHK